MRRIAIWSLVTMALMVLPGPVVQAPAVAALAPRAVYEYREDFSSYDHKAYTQETEWDMFARRLALLPMSGGSYTEPAIASDGQGGAYVVWKDWRNRNIIGDADIYAQRVDGRGNRLWAADLRVNSDATQAYQSAPAIAVDSRGNALVVWADIRETPYAIYAQKLSPTGAKLWASDVRVNGAPAYRVGWGQLDSLAMAIDSHDNVVVVWQGNWDNDWSDPDVYAQKIDANGQRLWANDVRVNTDVGHGQYYMAVDVDAQGMIVVAWVDDRNGGEDIYAQRLDTNGNRTWSTEVKVSGGVGVLHQGNPNVVLDSQGNAVIVWRSGPSDPPIDWEVSTIYAQKVNPGGVLLWAGNVRVNRDTAHVFRGRPRADLVPGDDVLVIWEDNRRGYSTQGIFAQRLSPTGVLRWAADLSISPNDWWGQNMSGLSVEGNRTYVTWSRWGDLYVQVLDLTSSGLLLPVPALINESTGRADQCEADVAPLSDGRAIVAWVDTRRFNHDVRAQAISVDRQMVWPADFQVNGPELVDHWKPQVAANAHDQALVVWNGRNSIYGQLMDASGLRLWPADRRMNADDRWAAFADVAALPDETFVVAWIGQREPYGNLWDVYLQRVDETGNRLWDHDVRANTGDYYIPFNEVEERSRPAVAVDTQGHFVVAWRGDTGSAVDLYVRRLSSDGTPDWSQDLPLNSHLSLSDSGSEVLCAIVADSQITVAWSAGWNGHWGIYAQRLGLNGQTLWGSRWVSEVATQVFYGNPNLALTQSGDVVVVWDDEHQAGRNVYAQLLSPTGDLHWPEALRLNQADVWPLRPAVSVASDGTLIAVWHDGRHADDSVCAQRFTTAGDLLWSEDLELFPPGSEWYYYPQGVAESTTVDEMPGGILRASLTVSQTLDGGTVTYFLSNDGGQTWEETVPGELHTFNSVGSDLRWKAILHASDDLHRSPVIQTLTIRYGSDVIGDAYEPEDDACAGAQFISPHGTVQRHNFHDQADTDWLTFDAVSGTTYLIEAQVPVGSPADVALELYDRCGALALASQDYAFSPGVRLEFQALADGSLYLKLLNHDPTVYGTEVAYHLSVRALEDTPTPGAVVLVAGRLRMNDPLQDNIHHVASAVYRLFWDHGYDDDRITYLATDLGLGGVDALPTKTNLQAAITTWAPNRVGPDRPFTLYMADHGGYDKFYLDKPRDEWLMPQEVDNWLTHLEQAVPGVKVNVIVEACHSGSFIDLPQKVSRSGRVVIASTGAWNRAWASNEGAMFSDHFVAALRQEASLYASFQTARWAAQSAYPNQTPWLDDDGDGIANEAEDGQEAAQRGFAYAGTLPPEVWPPYIVQTIGPAEIEHGQGVVRAEVRDDEQVKRVWAVIYPPSYQPPEPGEEMVQEALPTIVLQDRGSDWYGATYTGFSEVGVYRVVIYAEDHDGLEARPLATEVRTGWPVYLPLVLR